MLSGRNYNVNSFENIVRPVNNTHTLCNFIHLLLNSIIKFFRIVAVYSTFLVTNYLYKLYYKQNICSRKPPDQSEFTSSLVWSKVRKRVNFWTAEKSIASPFGQVISDKRMRFQGVVSHVWNVINTCPTIVVFLRLQWWVGLCLLAPGVCRTAGHHPLPQILCSCQWSGR